jgi:hypothetical protein
MEALLEAREVEEGRKKKRDKEGKDARHERCNMRANNRFC